MADQQNPIQNDNQATPTTPVNNDLLGDISLDNSAGQTVTQPVEVSDLGSMLVEQSLDATQQKAEESIPNVPVDTIADVNAAPVTNDPTSIDLGDITLAEEPASEAFHVEVPAAPVVTESNEATSVETATMSPEAPTVENPSPAEEPVAEPAMTEPVAEAISETLPVSEELSTQVTESTPTDETKEAVNNTPVETPVVQATEKPAEISIPGLSSAPDIAEADLSNINEELLNGAVTPDSSTTEKVVTEEATSVPAETPVNEMPVETPIIIDPTTEELPQDITEQPQELPTEQPIEEVTSSPEVVPTPMDLPLPEEKTDDLVDSLITNEQTQVSAPTPATNEDMTLDLDALTGAIAATTDNATNTETPTTTPVAASVSLPNATLVQPQAHKSTKKKAFAMAAAFIMLLIVGAFVFHTMMPEESNKFLANILGSSPATNSTNDTLAPEVPTTQSDVGGLIDDASLTDDTSSLTEDDTTIQNTDPGNQPATNSTNQTNPDNTTTPDTTTETPTSNTPTNNNISTMTFEQGEAILSMIVQTSRKELVNAKKASNKQAETALYNIWKESSNLLQTLANSRDISTIENADTTISNLQRDLNQAIITLNVAGSNNTQSQ